MSSAVAGGAAPDAAAGVPVGVGAGAVGACADPAG